MPELPEVETIKRDLEHRVLNKQIKDIWIETSFAKKISPDAAEFLSLIGHKFTCLARKAKLLVFCVDDDRFVLCHLKMTGQLVYRVDSGKIVAGGHEIVGATTVPNKYTRVIFSFKDKSKLYFNDLRKFGYFKLLDESSKEKELQKYGIDALDSAFDFQKFLEIIKSKPTNRIKQFLMSQDLISGLGNIYADEVLFAAKVKPARRAKSLKKAEKEKLFHEIKRILRSGIEHGGTSVNTYRNGIGNEGGFQHLLKVYGKAGEPCSVCGENLRKTKIGGRTSNFCPKCQK
jgi:formamidopyrimidine-DNA glycosylase